MKSALLVLVWCYKARGDREQDLWRYRLSEGCIKQWYDKPSGCGCLGKKCEQGSNEMWAGGTMKCEQGEQWRVSKGSNGVWEWGAMKCEHGELWTSNNTVSGTLAKLSNIQSENTVFETLCFTPLTTISSDTAVRSLIPLLFLRSLSSPIINIRSCLQDLKLSLIVLYGVSSIYWVLLLQTSYISVSWL